MMELFQGEGGIILFDVDFVKGVCEFCDKYNVLFIFDEVQLGVGCIGYFYVYMGFGVIFDILIIVKFFGGGFLIGVMFIIVDIVVYFKLGIYGSIYGGNLLVCVVVEKVLDIVNQLEVFEGVFKKEVLFCELLGVINEKYNVFEEVCG